MPGPSTSAMWSATLHAWQQQYGHRIRLLRLGVSGGHTPDRGLVDYQPAAGGRDSLWQWDGLRDQHFHFQQPAYASESAVGTIASEAFDVLGTQAVPPPPCFEENETLHIIHDFTQFSVSDGITLDKAGNLYGAFQSGGDYGNGMVFELSPRSRVGSLIPCIALLEGPTADIPLGRLSLRTEAFMA